MSEKEVLKTTKKTPRKKAVKKAVSKTASTKKTAVSPQKGKTVVRKAPTPVAENNAYKNKNRAVLWVGVIVFVIVVGGSAAFGMSGSGEIDISGRIADVKEQATPEERSVIDSIPVQKTRLPDGGLVPSGVPEEVPAPKPVEVASSTDLTATSTSQTSTSTDVSVISDEETLPDEADATVTDSSTETASTTEGL